MNTNYDQTQAKVVGGMEGLDLDANAVRSFVLISFDILVSEFHQVGLTLSSRKPAHSRLLVPWCDLVGWPVCMLASEQAWFGRFW